MIGAHLSPPTRLEAGHDLQQFICGVPVLDAWLKGHALKNEAAASRTYVACQGMTVIGYYALATGAVSHDVARGRVRRNRPDPVPVIVLGRLAVDHRYRRRGIGGALLLDAIRRVLRAAGEVGVRAIVVHAISEEAKRFYLNADFLGSPIEPMTLCLPLEAARDALGGSRAS